MRFATLLILAIFTFAIAHAEVYEPKPGTPLRKAIMDAMRVPISKHIGKTVEFSGELKVSGDWARFGGNVAPKDGKAPKNETAQSELELDFFALLQKMDGEWKVLSWGFSGDISAYEAAKQKYPQAPKDLMPDLPQ